MPGFDRAVIDAVQREREVELTTFGRKTGKASRRVLWAFAGDDRIWVRSGGGLVRDWPRNLLANGRGILHVAGVDVPVRARHLGDVADARAAGQYGRRKYGASFRLSTGDEAPTPGEQATFELTSDE
jgi:deazaflavin-dependent oxidoreductase (nitroreductase family)